MKRTALKKNRLPDWFKQDIPDAEILAKLRSLKKQGVNTVCLEANCPNWSRCLGANSLAFMLLGSRCTRDCRFCAVDKSGKESLGLDGREPYRILETVKELRLRFVIITSVSRDDLADKGAGQFAETINLIHNYDRDIKIEVLIPDFLGPPLSQVVQTHPDVLAHNLETVPRLYPRIRSQASYERSLGVLAESKKLDSEIITKSSLLLGMTEEEEEVVGVMDDLARIGCDILVLGQYLAPSPSHYPVEEYVTCEQFRRYEEIGLTLGFKSVISSPLARTSYRAEEAYNRVKRIAFSV
ncbi:MAG: lipoyl synthase [Candidatus Omnitrophota bacterium]